MSAVRSERLIALLFTFSVLSIAQSRPELVLQTGQVGSVGAIASSPDGRLLASANNTERSIKIWDAATGVEVRTIPAESEGTSILAFDPDGGLLAAADGSGAFRVWDLATGNKLYRVPPGGFARPEMSFVAKGRLLLVRSSPSTPAKLLDARSGRELPIALDGVAIGVSADGRIAASTMSLAEMLPKYSGGEFDELVHLTDVATGKKLRPVAIGRADMTKGRRNNPEILALNSDGSRLATGHVELLAPKSGQEGEYIRRVQIDVWDTSTGKKLASAQRSFPGSGAPYGRMRLAFGPGDQKLGWILEPYPMRGNRSGPTLLTFWDPASGKELSSFEAPAPQYNPSERLLSPGAQLSADSRKLGVAVGDQIKVFDTSTGRELVTVGGHSKWMSAFAFSYDGRKLATGTLDQALKLWDAESGRELRNFAFQLPPVQTVRFSPDGRWLNIAGAAGVNRWEVATGRQLHSVAASGASAISADSSVAGLVSGDPGSIAVLNLTSDRERAVAAIPAGRSVGGLALSPDGAILAVAERSYTWDSLITRFQTTVWNSPEKVDKAVALREELEARKERKGKADRKTAAMEQKVREVETAAGIVQYDPEAGLTGVLSSFADANKPEKRPTIRMWDLRNGRELPTISGHMLEIRGLAFSPDGSRIATGGTEGTIRVTEVATGREVGNFGKVTGRELGEKTGRTLSAVDRPDRIAELPITTLAFSPDGRRIAAGHSLFGSGGLTSLWDAETGRLVRAWFEQEEVKTVAFSPDGRRLAAGERNGLIVIRAADAGGAEIATCSGHRSAVESVAFTRNGDMIIAGSTDGMSRVWDVPSGRELVSIVSLPGGEWLAVTPDGLFDGTPAMWGRIAWRFSDKTGDIAPIEAYFNEFYSPGILGEIFAGRPPKAPRDLLALDRRQPALKLGVKEDAGAAIESRRVSLRIDVIQAPAGDGHAEGSGVRDLRLFRNGSLVRVWRGDLLPGKSDQVTLEADVPIVAGTNQFTAYAFNRDNVRSSTAALAVTGSDRLKRPGVLYVLAFGVNRYENPEFNLNYAVPDAKAFAAELRNQQSHLGGFASIETIELADAEATRTNILAALAKLKTLEPEDAVAIYFAGHGAAAQARFYLIPHDLGYAGRRSSLDAAGKAAILEHGISDADLERVLEQVDTGRILLVIDACQSGQALEAEEKRRGPMNSKGLAQLAYEKGMYILTAAQAYQAALEAAELGHGYLTYALLDGLKTRVADTNPSDGRVTAPEWLEYATVRVPELQESGMQKARAAGRDLAFVEGEEAVPTVAERSLQRPRLFYRQEAGSVPFIVSQPPN